MSAEVPSPHHVLIIPDGNRRWARERGLSTRQGHEVGCANIVPVTLEAVRRGVEIVTMPLLTVDNMKKRRPEEVEGIKEVVFGSTMMPELEREGGKISFIGDNEKAELSDVREKEKAITARTRDNDKFHVVFGINYSGPDELLRAQKKMLKLGVEPTDEKTINDYLDTARLPDPDLVIRTGGEKRLSGIEPLQTAQSELYFTDKLWPDFDGEDLGHAFADYASRERRFGS